MDENTVAWLKCKPGYRKPTNGAFVERVNCLADGNWSSHIPRCNPICGELTLGVGLISGGRQTNVSEVPWHVGIYRRYIGNQFSQICGGTIITPTHVISAAHCFWDEETKQLFNLDMFAVMAGKSQRDYYAPENGAQTFSVQNIEVPHSYGGGDDAYISDFAVIELSTSIIFKPYIAPACLEFPKRADQVFISDLSISKNIQLINQFPYVTAYGRWNARKSRRLGPKRG